MPTFKKSKKNYFYNIQMDYLICHQIIFELCLLDIHVNIKEIKIKFDKNYNINAKDIDYIFGINVK